MPGGRKQADARKYFLPVSVAGSDKKLQKSFACMFCQWKTTENASRMRLHIQKCNACPSSVQEKFQSIQCNAITGYTAGYKRKAAVVVVSQDSQAHCSNSSPNDGQDAYDVDLMTSTAGTSSESDVNTLPNKKTNMCVKSFLNNFVHRMTPDKQQENEMLLAKAIYSSGTPLSIVDNNQWQIFFRNLRPSFQLPGRNALSGRLLDTECETVKANVESVIREADCVGLICDGWSNLRNEAILNFVVTTPNPILYKTMTTGEESHTGKFMAKVMNEVIDKLGPKKVLGVCTDNASNMKSAWSIVSQKPGQEHISCYGCLAHGINLLMTEIGKLQTVQKVVNDAKGIVKEVKASHILSANLRRRQRDADATRRAKESGKGKGKGKSTSKSSEHQSAKLPTVCSLKLPVPTRWGSNVMCLESVKYNRPHLMAMAVDHQALKQFSKHSKDLLLNDDFWSRLTRTCDLLQPVASSVQFIESDKPQISQSAKLFAELKAHFDTALPASPLSKEEELQVQNHLSARRNFCIKALHKAANLLDPNINGKDLTEEEQLEAVEFIANISEYMDDIDGAELLSDVAMYRANESIWSKPFIWDSARKLSAYIWWKGMCSSRKNLSTVAARILQMPATSAAVERSFSTYGNIHSARRNRLTSERAGKLVYVSQNLRMKKYTNQSREEKQTAMPQAPQPHEKKDTEEVCLPPFPQLSGSEHNDADETSCDDGDEMDETSNHQLDELDDNDNETDVYLTMTVDSVADSDID